MWKDCFLGVLIKSEKKINKKLALGPANAEMNLSSVFFIFLLRNFFKYSSSNRKRFIVFIGLTKHKLFSST